MLGGKRHDFQCELFAQRIEDQPSGGSLASQDDGTRLENGEGTDPTLRGVEDQIEKSVLFGFSEKDGQQSGAIQNKTRRQKSPLSS